MVRPECGFQRWTHESYITKPLFESDFCQESIGNIRQNCIIMSNPNTCVDNTNTIKHIT